MKYAKPPRSYDQLADLLMQRGLLADKNILVLRLKSVSYYRLSGYWYPFRNPDDTFKPGTTFDKIWSRYTFDRRLRLLVLDAIERIEIAVRTALSHEFSHLHGAFGHLEPKNLPNLSEKDYSDFIQKIDYETNHSTESFVKHFKTKYGDSHSHLPLWMAAEIMTFGMLLTFFKGIPGTLKQKIAGHYGIPDIVFESWLRAFNGIRNTCAHHSRLWNKELGYKPLFPRERKHPEWHIPVEIPNNRIFGILSICRFLLKQIAPQSRWPERLENLFAEYPAVPRQPMGFPDNWKQSPVWK